jgi:hypothetical protein
MAEQQTKQTPADTGKADTKVKGEQQEADGEPMTLTKAELQKLIDDNRAEAQTAAEKAAEARLAEKERKRAEAAEAAEAEKRGEFDKVKARIEAERDAERLTTKRLEARLALRDYLGADDKRRPYLPSAEWIEKAVDISADTDPKDVPKLVAAAADKFIADNPRETKVPAAGPKSAADIRGRAAEAAVLKNGEERKPALSRIGSGF